MKTPILKLQDILLTSIQIDMDDEAMSAFQNDVMLKLSETEAKGIIIDITALDVVDSFMARMINETAIMARMLGALVVLCGMQPDVALALTEMGRELVDVETALNLDQGFEKLQRLIAERQT